MGSELGLWSCRPGCSGSGRRRKGRQRVRRLGAADGAARPARLRAGLRRRAGRLCRRQHVAHAHCRVRCAALGHETTFGERVGDLTQRQSRPLRAQFLGGLHKRRVALGIGLAATALAGRGLLGVAAAFTMARPSFLRKMRLSQYSTCEKNSRCWQPACSRSLAVKKGVRCASHF
jgi:hypothetical protein